LRIRELTPADAPFILALLNDPDFIRNIGDRNVRTPDDARRYIEAGPMASYARHGFGLCLVQTIDGAEPIGICGVLKRDELPEPDIGFAFLPAYRSQGYAREAATAVLTHARAVLRLPRLLAFVNPDNGPSIRLLERLGFRFERMIRLNNRTVDLKLFALAPPSPPSPPGSDPCLTPSERDQR
jgi:RimJ/RimL family protein N-acetyltransferase